MDGRDLVGFSRQTLYEFEMVEHLAKRQVDLLLGKVQDGWADRLGSHSSLDHPWFERNAIAESFLIHVRNLTTFLYKTRSTAERTAARKQRAKAGGEADAYADDYFDEPIEDWRKVRGRRPKVVSDDALNLISREIAHMSYERAKFVDGGSLFNPFAMYQVLATPMGLFAEHADASRVSDDFGRRVAEALPMHRPQRPVFPVATQAMPPSS
jgi:hypothetical protein